MSEVAQQQSARESDPFAGLFIESWIRAGNKRKSYYPANHLPELSVRGASVETVFLWKNGGEESR